MSLLRDALIGARLVARLPGFLRPSLDAGEAREIVRRRLARRGADFLELVRRAVYEQPGSPYRALLRHAGCEFGDLQRLVERGGLDEALRVLLARGVYLTGDELKGHRPVTRGSLHVVVDPARLRNPSARAHLVVATSGSRGARTPVPVDLAFVRDGAISDAAALGALGRDNLSAAVWKPPGGDALWTLLRVAVCGTLPERWFSQIDPADRELSLPYRWSARALRFGGWLAGERLPRPEHVRVDDPGEALRWAAARLREGRTPLLHTFVSSAVRACLAALEAGVDLRGARLMVGGEPLTAARAAVLRRASGQPPQARYASGEAGVIGLGCLRPEVPDDVHVFEDLNALVQASPGEDPTGLPAGALFVTSIRPAAPVVLLNASLGDVGVLAPRACGCGLDAIGWPTHLQGIRSYEKLTAAGVTFLDRDVVAVLEDVLPACFGGAPTDYQLVEDEGPDGRPRLRVFVRPEVGAIAPGAMRDVFLAALGRLPGGQVTERVWRDGHVLEIERRAPLATPSGKILHLHALAPRPGSPRADCPGPAPAGAVYAGAAPRYPREEGEAP
jgi:hypothetical protein